MSEKILAKNAKNSLKYGAAVIMSALTISIPILDAEGKQIGSKDATVPLNTRIICDNDATAGYVSFPQFSAMVSLKTHKHKGLPDTYELEAMADDADCTELVKELEPRINVTRNVTAVEVPKELVEAAKHIPEGYRFVIGDDGMPKLVKKRERKSKDAGKAPAKQAVTT